MMPFLNTPKSSPLKTAPIHLSATAWLLLGVILLSPWMAQAAQLPDFKATFDIRVLGFKIGQAHQKMQCDQGDCRLTSEAIPPDWAKAFINESALEEIRLQQTDKQFKWLEYKKFLTREYDDRTEHKTYTLVRRADIHKIEYVEKQTFWPEQTHLYDVISLAYGIQYQLLNNRSLTDFYLQDDKIQQKIQFTEQNQNERIDLPFAEALPTQRFAFHNDKIDAQLWVLPEMGFFPAKIVIFNKEEDRKIVLELNQKPATP